MGDSCSHHSWMKEKQQKPLLLTGSGLSLLLHEVCSCHQWPSSQSSILNLKRKKETNKGFNIKKKSLKYSSFAMLCQFQVCSKVNLLCIYIYPLFLRFFSHIGHYKVLSRVSCAMQQVLISYLSYMQQCICQSQFSNLSLLPFVVVIQLLSHVQLSATT